MFSIRNIFAAMTLGVLLIGCRTKQADQPVTLNKPVAADEATLKRDWDQSTARYTNTSVPAGPDRSRLEPSNVAYGQFLDTPLFLANSVLLPFTYIDQGPNATVSNTTVSQSSSFTAVPPTAPETAGVISNYSGRTPRSRLTPANAPGSIGGGGAGSDAGTGGAGGAAPGR